MTSSGQLARLAIALPSNARKKAEQSKAKANGFQLSLE
jgi:hypothetical protein